MLDEDAYLDQLKVIFIKLLDSREDRVGSKSRQFVKLSWHHFGNLARGKYVINSEQKIPLKGFNLLDLYFRAFILRKKSLVTRF